ncbi:hypothetical protein BX616_001280, partial [Lobosporangium transversale]
MSLPPPPRRIPSVSSNATTRRPKVNPNSLALTTLDQHQEVDDQNVDKALLELLSNTCLDHGQDRDYIRQHFSNHYHHPQCKFYTRRRSITSDSSLGSGSEIYSTSTGGSQENQRTSQATHSPLFPELSAEPIPAASPLLATSPMYFNSSNNNHNAVSFSTGPCLSCQSYSCPSIIAQEEKKGKDGVEKTATTLFCPRGSSEVGMEGTAPFSSSCSYCSSLIARSNSSTSMMMTDDSRSTSDMSVVSTLHAHGLQHLLFDDQRLKHLRTLVPSEVRRRLSFHLDECWFVHFSPSAEYMASIGLDHTINLWKDLTTPDPSVYKTFSFPRTATHVEWSPDSKYVLANFGNDIFRPELIPEVNLIDVENGEILIKRSYKNDFGYVWANAIGWFSDSERFVTALDDGLYCIWNVNGEMVKEYAMDNDLTARHMKMIPGRDEAVILTKAHTIEIISFEETVIARRLDSSISITMSMTISPDGSYMALGSKTDKELLRPAQILLYDLRSMTFMRSFEADSYMNQTFVIIPAFVGPNQELLCAGSENGKLHFWDIESGELVEVLEEHMMHAGCVSVNPKYPGMISS